MDFNQARDAFRGFIDEHARTTEKRGYFLGGELLAEPRGFSVDARLQPLGAVNEEVYRDLVTNVLPIVHGGMHIRYTHILYDTQLER